jgi:acetyl esterase/lipase
MRTLERGTRVLALCVLLLAACAQAEPSATTAPTLAPTPAPSTPTATIEQADPTILSQLDIPYGPGEQQKLDVFYKEDFVDAPIILLIFGFRWDAGDKILMHTSPEDLETLQGPEHSEEVRFWATTHPVFGRELAQYFVDLGFAAVTPNYRLVTRDGENAFPASVNDLGCAAAWMKQNAAQFGGDPSTMFVLGYFTGAHVGAMLAYNPERDWLEECPIQDEDLTFKGFIGLAGIYDFSVTRLDTYVGPPICFLLSDLLDLEGLEVYRCVKDPDFSRWAEASPVDHISPGDPPALLVAGDADCLTNIPDPETGLCTANADRFATALSDARIQANVLILPGINTGPSGVLDTSDIGEAVEEFLEQVQ